MMAGQWSIILGKDELLDLSKVWKRSIKLIKKDFSLDTGKNIPKWTDMLTQKGKIK